MIIQPSDSPPVRTLHDCLSSLLLSASNPRLPADTLTFILACQNSLDVFSQIVTAHAHCQHPKHPHSLPPCDLLTFPLLWFSCQFYVVYLSWPFLYFHLPHSAFPANLALMLCGLQLSPNGGVTLACFKLWSAIWNGVWGISLVSQGWTEFKTWDASLILVQNRDRKCGVRCNN